MDEICIALTDLVNPWYDLLSNSIIEPYNAILATKEMLEYSSATFVVDNQALFNISKNNLKI